MEGFETIPTLRLLPLSDNQTYMGVLGIGHLSNNDKEEQKEKKKLTTFTSRLGIRQKQKALFRPHIKPVL